MLTDEQKSRLDPFQLVIAEKWEREADARDVALKEMEAARKAEDIEAYDKAFDKFLQVDEVNDGRCEHDRSIMGTCAGCEEIQQLLYPEFYDQNGDILSDEEIDALILKDK